MLKYSYVTSHSKSKYYPILPAVYMILASLGCSGPEFGEIRVPPAQQYTLAESKADVPLTLPADQPFAIHLKKSSQDAGHDGRARGDSTATPAGQASCLAEVANGGTAAAEFSIGHRIDNPGQAQLAQIQLNFVVKQSLEASPGPTAETIASANLMLVVLDSRKKTVAKVPIVQTSSDQALREDKGEHQSSLNITFESQQSYDVMLFGQVQASSSANQEAKANVVLEKLTMQFRFSPVTTQPAAR